MKRKKATDIKPEVKKRVEERDGWCCIFCREFGESGFEPTDHAHYIGRAQGGLGIEENLVYVCPAHHFEMDNGKNMKNTAISAASILRICIRTGTNRL